MAKKSRFWAEISAFLGQGFNLCPAYPISRLLDWKKDELHPPAVSLHLVQGLQHQKKNTPPSKMVKKCQFLAQISVFWGLGVRFVAPPTLI